MNCHNEHEVSLYHIGLLLCQDNQAEIPLSSQITATTAHSLNHTDYIIRRIAIQSYWHYIHIT